METVAKGTSFIGILKAADRRRPDARKAIVERTSGELRHALEYGHIVQVGWYPVDWYGELLCAARAAFDGDETIPWQLSHDATREDFKGVFSVIIRVLSVEAVFRRGMRLMMLYWKGGTVEATSAAGRGSVRFRGWRGFDRNIWLDLQGGLSALLELRGASGLAMRVAAGGDDGCDDMDLAIRWR